MSTSLIHKNAILPFFLYIVLALKPFFIVHKSVFHFFFLVSNDCTVFFSVVLLLTSLTLST